MRGSSLAASTNYRHNKAILFLLYVNNYISICAFINGAVVCLPNCYLIGAPYHIHRTSLPFRPAMAVRDSHPTKHPRGNVTSSSTGNGCSPNDH